MFFQHISLRNPLKLFVLEIKHSFDYLFFRLNLFCVFGYLACMFICAPCVCSAQRRGHQITLYWKDIWFWAMVQVLAMKHGWSLNLYATSLALWLSFKNGRRKFLYSLCSSILCHHWQRKVILGNLHYCSHWVLRQGWNLLFLHFGIYWMLKQFGEIKERRWGIAQESWLNTEANKFQLSVVIHRIVWSSLQQAANLYELEIIKRHILSKKELWLWGGK